MLLSGLEIELLKAGLLYVVAGVIVLASAEWGWKGMKKVKKVLDSKKHKA